MDDVNIIWPVCCIDQQLIIGTIKSVSLGKKLALKLRNATLPKYILAL